MTGGPRKEIERKFLVVGDDWRKQGDQPMPTSSRAIWPAAARRRSGCGIKDGKHATLTIKSRESGVSRPEFEYRVPLKRTRELMALCGSSRIEKQRYMRAAGQAQVGDRCLHPAAPTRLVLVIGRDRAASAKTRWLKLPKDWIGEEVTDDPRVIRNSSLATRPEGRITRQQQAVDPAASSRIAAPARRSDGSNGR